MFGGSTSLTVEICIHDHASGRCGPDCERPIVREMKTTRLAALVAAALAIAPVCSAQTPKLLQITSPANGAVVYPGQTVKVTVTSPANAQFETLGLLSPITGVPVVASSPAALLLRVPPTIATGKYPVTVMARTKSGQSASAIIEISVERPDLPVRLSFLNDWQQLEFTVAEEPFHMNVLATFADGETLEVTESASLTFRSSNPHVATVDRLGAITPVGAGSAVVSAIYTSGGRTVRVAVSVSVQP
jgi:hypothetical protein